MVWKLDWLSGTYHDLKVDIHSDVCDCFVHDTILARHSPASVAKRPFHSSH